MRIIEFLRFKSIWWAAALILIALAGLFVLRPTKTHAENERVITIYHDGAEQTVVTDAPNVEDVLKRTGINLGKNDFVEPALDTVLEAPAYNINIYRARPILVEDGAKKYQISSPHSSPQKIAEAAGLKLHDEDLVELSRSDDLLSDGVGLKLTIQRATHVVLVLYGTQKDVYTQSATVGGFLNEKGIKFGSDDGTNLALQTPITGGIKLEVWRNGVQTITEEQEVKFPTELIRDTSKDVGFKEVKEPGKSGKKLVTYEVELRNGKELARKEIQSVTTEEPKKQVEVIGTKVSASGNGVLSKSKGVNIYVDTNGVAHRETYYDLPMSGTMRSCNGSYSVRADGAKVDQDGYVLVAANLSRYPRCSIVETSLGLGRVYDTGGFAAVHPDGFDLATDWTNNNGN